MEIVPPTQEHEIPVADIANDIVEHAVDNGQLTLPSQVTPPSWLAEAMINMNAHSVSTTNEESMNMPSQPAELNSEIVHFFVDNRSMEEDEGHNEASNEDNDIVQSVPTDTKREVLRNGMQVGGVEKTLGQFLKLPLKIISMKKSKVHWVVFVWAEAHSYSPQRTI